jgi:mRNA interferase YafQ
MREIEYTNQFFRDYKREQKGANSTHLDMKLAEVIDSLIANKPLARKFQDHALKGEYAGARECHLRPDLLLIYIFEGASALKLVRLGSHSELF